MHLFHFQLIPSATMLDPTHFLPGVAVPLFDHALLLIFRFLFFFPFPHLYFYDLFFLFIPSTTILDPTHFLPSVAVPLFDHALLLTFRYQGLYPYPHRYFYDLFSPVLIYYLHYECLIDFVFYPSLTVCFYKLVNYPPFLDRKSTRLNSSHVSISSAVFCFK